MALAVYRFFHPSANVAARHSSCVGTPHRRADNASQQELREARCPPTVSANLTWGFRRRSSSRVQCHVIVPQRQSDDVGDAKARFHRSLPPHPTRALVGADGEEAAAGAREAAQVAGRQARGHHFHQQVRAQRQYHTFRLRLRCRRYTPHACLESLLLRCATAAGPLALRANNSSRRRAWHEGRGRAHTWGLVAEL